MKIEGVHDDVEIIRWGKCRGGQKEMYLVGLSLEVWTPNIDSVLDHLIVRKIGPVCAWPRGVFNDGWIADEDAGIFWYQFKPTWNGDTWSSSDSCNSDTNCLLNPPVFRDDLPMHQRIQQVGPTFESQETV